MNKLTLGATAVDKQINKRHTNMTSTNYLLTISVGVIALLAMTLTHSLVCIVLVLGVVTNKQTNQQTHILVKTKKNINGW